MEEKYDSRPETYKHIDTVRRLLTSEIEELLRRANNHDASKLIDPELETFNEYTPKLKDSTFGSDEYKGFLEGMGVALEHHYTENRHHPQHFPNGINDMTLVDLIEMICDWIAATQRHSDGDIGKSLEINQDRFGYDDQLKKIMRNTVVSLGWLPND